MGIITGYICLILLLILLVKYVTKRVGAIKLNRILQKIHIIIAILFVLVTAVHFVLVLPVLKTRALTVTGFGIFLMILAVILTAASLYMRKKGRMSIKLHHIISLFLLVGLVGHLAFYYIDFAEYQSAIADIEVKDVDISELENGDYVGDYDAGYIYAKVRVSIQEGRVDHIEILEHRNERGAIAEKIVDEMVNQQKVNVDTVSGATNSSKVIKKAVENALAN